MRLVLYVAVAFTLGLVLLTSGCAMFGAPTGMSADQLSAYAKDKNSSAVCWTVLGPGWTSHVVAVNFDETRYAGGTITVNPDCAATITSEVVPAIPRPARVPPVVVAPPVVPAPTVGPATSPLPPFVPAVTYAMSSDGNCIRTERDSSGRVTAAATVDKARCQ